MLLNFGHENQSIQSIVEYNSNSIVGFVYASEENNNHFVFVVLVVVNTVLSIKII